MHINYTVLKHRSLKPQSGNRLRWPINIIATKVACVLCVTCDQMDITIYAPPHGFAVVRSAARNPSLST